MVTHKISHFVVVVIHCSFWFVLSRCSADIFFPLALFGSLKVQNDEIYSLSVSQRFFLLQQEEVQDSSLSLTSCHGCWTKPVFKSSSVWVCVSCCVHTRESVSVAGFHFIYFVRIALLFLAGRRGGAVVGFSISQWDGQLSEQHTPWTDQKKRSNCL